MKAVKEIFADNLKLFRDRKGLSVAALAKLAEQEPASIHRYEGAQRFPKPEIIDRLAEVLGVSADDFFREEPYANGGTQRRGTAKQVEAPSALYDRFLRQEVERQKQVNRKLLYAFKDYQNMIKTLEGIVDQQSGGDERLLFLASRKFTSSRLKEVLLRAMSGDDAALTLVDELSGIGDYYIQAPESLRLVIRVILSGDPEAAEKLELMNFGKKELAALEQVAVAFRVG